MIAIRDAMEADFATMLAIVNDAARAYRGVIPADRWHEPYMTPDELRKEIADGVVFRVAELDGVISGVMGIQDRGDVALVRHAYVVPLAQRSGVGTVLLQHVQRLVDRPILIGTWAAASWAVEFYRRNGFTVVPDDEKERLLRTYWSIPDRQVETSVVLADERWTSRRAERHDDPRAYAAVVAEEVAPMRHVVRWRRLDHPAEEDAVVERTGDDAWRLRGAVRGTLDDGRDYALRYEVACARDWVTHGATVAGHVGGVAAHVALARDGATGRWTRDGVPVPSLDGCLDVDLGFSPSTNMLPIRRLALPVGGESPVRAAWLRFPGFELEPLDQRYRNLGEGRYAYESGAGRFRATLEVDALGVVRRYGDYWVADASAGFSDALRSTGG